ncbi:MAG: ABC transporter ATP-binding protein, partial [Microvirga sp.]
LMLGLLAPTAGHVVFDGTDLAAAPPAIRRTLRRRMQLVFQDPYGSLDPRRTVGAQIADPLDIHDLLPAARRPARVAELLEQVGLDGAHAARYPHQFSGGQRQRVAIARALAMKPDLLVCDEPVASLDVSIQAQIINLFLRLRRELDLTMLFISHDLGIVRHLCDRVAVMYLGRIVESGPTAAVYAAPRHPYTKALMEAVPKLEGGAAAFRPIAGEIPSPTDPPKACAFHPRCPLAIERCRIEPPELRVIVPGRRAACHRAEEVGPPFVGTLAADLPLS